MLTSVSVFLIMPGMLIASDNQETLATGKETMTNSFQKIETEIESLEKSPNADSLIRIGQSIRSLPITQKEERGAKLELWLKAISKIDQMIDPAFDPNDVPQINVAPPSPFAFDSGASPDAIKDTKVRVQYEQAIKANAAKAERYRFQKKLREADAEWSLTAKAYIKTQYSSDAKDIKEVDDLLDKLIFGSSKKEYMKNILHETK
jgi:hypothetical protein